MRCRPVELPSVTARARPGKVCPRSPVDYIKFGSQFSPRPGAAAIAARPPSWSTAGRSGQWAGVPRARNGLNRTPFAPTRGTCQTGGKALEPRSSVLCRPGCPDCKPGARARRLAERNLTMPKVRVFQVPHELKRRGPEECPWSIEWRENGRRRSKTIGAKEGAEEAAAVKLAELLDRAKGINTRKKWSDFVEEYLRDEMEGSNKRPATVDLVRTILHTFTETIKPKWVHLIDAQALDQYRKARLKHKGLRGNLSPFTVRKELRHLHAALGVAKRWRYLGEIPPLPRVAVDEREKCHISEPHFLAMLKHCDVATRPNLKIHDTLPLEATIGDWWRALLVTLWVTGARIDAVLRLRWEDVDFDAGRVLSRAPDLKQRKDSRPEIRGALPYLIKLRGADPRLLPWNHDRRTLYPSFHAIQQAAGIDLPCPQEGEPGHECGAACHRYGFHAFRYAHARFNYANPELQNQMGHACASTTEHYRKWGKRQMTDYGAYLPAALDGGTGEGQRKNAGDDGGKPRLRVVAG